MKSQKKVILNFHGRRHRVISVNSTTNDEEFPKEVLMTKTHHQKPSRDGKHFFHSRTRF